MLMTGGRAGRVDRPRHAVPMSRRRGALAALLALVLVVSVSPGREAAWAADLKLTNSGFESDLTGWSQWGEGGNTVSTARAYEGVKSARITDGDTTTGTGLESGLMTAKAGTRYAAFARVYVESGAPDLYLRFYTSSGTLTGNFYTNFTGAPGSWSVLKVTGTAPADATKMSVLAYSSKSNTGVAHYDQMLVTAAVTDLGWQIDNAGVNGSTFGIGANQNKIYSIVTGSNDASQYPAKFGIIDVDTEQVVGTPSTLSGAIGGWAATTATDGNVYLGSYNNGHLYRHTPGTTGVTDLGQAITGQSFVWAVTAGSDGRVYGGTYSGAGYFKYEPANGFTTIGSTPIWPGKEYVRSIAFDAAQGATYLGVGTNAALVRFDRVTGQKDDILPSKYAGISMVGGLTFTGNRLFTVMANGVCTVLDVVRQADGSYTGVEEANFPSALPVSPERDGKVYAVSGGGLAVYDIAARQLTSLGVPVGFSAKQFGWVRLADQVNYPGETLVLIGSQDGRSYLLRYNPTNGATRTAEIANLPGQPTNINVVTTGPDGNIWTGGYLSGGNGVYRPFQGDGNDERVEQVYRGLSQTEGMLAYQGKMYIGTYSGAKVYEHDPSQPWQVGTNPRQLAVLSGVGQDRPYALAAGGGKLFVGTVPGYGRYDGALTVFDLATGAYTPYVDLVPNQSVVSLVYLNGLVWGGTTIRGGLGVDQTPKATEAKLFVFDPATGAKTEYALPASRKLKALTALTVVGGKIWGVAEGFVFVFDPVTRTFTTPPTEKFTDITFPLGAWKDAKLLTVPQDTANVYGTAGDYLFRIDRSTLAVTKLVSTGADYLAADEYGNLYYSRYERLFRYVP